MLGIEETDGTEDQSIFEEEKYDIFGNVYLANTQNRLRQLDNPDDVDCKRWPWELVQNAKDSISNSNRKSVDIEICVDNDTYTFKHNGEPFNIKSLTALMYKYSSGKRNNSESTGRFGTGFLTTHSLSKIVQIQGDIIIKGKCKGFSLTMYREGEGEELLNGLKRTEKSFKTNHSPFGWTAYTYHASTRKNKEAGRMGIQNFKENIAKVILFCPEINSIKLFDNGKLFEIERGKEINLIGSDCQKLTLSLSNNGVKTKKTYLYTKYNKPNDELTERFEVRRNLRICCAVELDDNNNIFVDTSSPCLFCSLPLVGSEAHELPFIINSPDFEPDSERQAILLDGDRIDEKTKKISVPGINKMILDKSKSMYRTLLEFICKNNSIGNRYSMARGLQSIPNVYRSFNGQWYYDNFICPMRNILLEYPIVWNGTQYFKLTSVYLPKFDKQSKEYEKKAYQFIFQLYKLVPTYEDSLLIKKTIWKNDSRLHYVNMKQCVEKIEGLKTLDELNRNIDVDVWSWLSRFLSFIQVYHNEYLQIHAIIPNMNNKFIKQTKDIASSTNVQENMIDCIENLGMDWRNCHINKRIVSFTTGTDHNIDYAVSKIRVYLKNNPNKKLILIHYIPYDCGDEKFIKKRKMLYEFCKTLWSDKMYQIKDGTTFPKELWRDIDEKVFKELLQTIENYGQLNDVITINFLNRFLECVLEYYYYYSSYSIIPNKNGKLCRKSSLYRDDNIPSLFKQCLKECFFKDINEELIHDDITSSILLGKKSIYDYSDFLHENFKKSETYNYYNINNYMSSQQKEKAALYLIRIIPKVNSEITSDYDTQNKQINLYKLYKKFTKRNYITSKIERNEKNEKIWIDSNKHIIKMIKNIIERYSNITDLSNYLGITYKETIKYLKQFTLFSSEGRVIPNQNGKLCQKISLYNEGKWEDISNEYKLIPDEMKEIANLLKYDVKNILIHSDMGRICGENKSYEEICNTIDKLIISYYNADKKNKNLKVAAQYLIEIYFDNIGDDQAKIDFPNTFLKKDDITLNVIYDKKTRKDITEFGKKFGEESISSLLNNENVVNDIITGELTDEKYDNLKKLENEYNKKDIKYILNNPELIKKSINEMNTNSYSISRTLSINKKIEIVENITSHDTNNDVNELIFSIPSSPVSIVSSSPVSIISSSSVSSNSSSSSTIKNDKERVCVSFSRSMVSEQRSYYADTFNAVMEYGDDFDFNNPINKRTGLCGEAYIYKFLKQTGEFKSVTWNSLLNGRGNGQLLEYKGDVYHIVENGSHYDILCETFDGCKKYIEVKSTVGEFGNKVPFYISKRQIEMMKTIKYPDEYVLAVVFNVMNNPDHFFMTLKSDNL